MKKEKIMMGKVPCILWGEASKKLVLYIHGKCGNKEEAADFAAIAVQKGYQVLSLDLPGHGERTKEMADFVPWHVTKELNFILEACKKKYNSISLYACSIGAWFSLLAFKEETFKQCLFVSPVLDMKHVITNMMEWAKVTVEELKSKQEIPTDFGETLSFQYWQYVLAHPIEKWYSPTSILYGTADHLTKQSVVEAFAKRFQSQVTLMKNGGHWFHTEEELKFMRDWIQSQFK